MPESPDRDPMQEGAGRREDAEGPRAARNGAHEAPARAAEEAKTIIARASGAMEQGLYARVLDLVEPIMGKDLEGSQRILALFLAGLAKVKRRDYGAARLYLADGLKALADCPQAASEISGKLVGKSLLNLGWLCYWEDRYAEAEKFLQAYLDHPGSEDATGRRSALGALVHVYAETGRHSAAVEAYRAWNPSSTEPEHSFLAQVAKCESLRGLGRLDEARGKILEGIDGYFHNVLALLMLEASRIEGARGDESLAGEYIREAGYFLPFYDDNEERRELAAEIGIQAWRLNVPEVVLQVGSEVDAEERRDEWIEALVRSQYARGRYQDCLSVCEANLGDSGTGEAVESLLRKLAILSADRLGRERTVRKHARIAIGQAMPSRDPDLDEFLRKHPAATRPEGIVERAIRWCGFS